MKTYGGVKKQLHTFLTSALHGGKWSGLPSGKETTVPFGYEAGCTPEPVWRWWQREKKILAPTGSRTPDVQPEA